MYAVFAIALLSISCGFIFVDTQNQLQFPSQDQPRSHIPPSLRNLEPCEKEGYEEDPTNCAKFYRCVNYGADDYSTLLLRHRFRCAPGTIYDSELSNCNHPDKMKTAPGSGCRVELTGQSQDDDQQQQHDQPTQSKQRAGARGFVFEDDSNRSDNENEADSIQIRRITRTKLRSVGTGPGTGTGSNSVSEEADSAPGGDIDPQYLRPLPLVKEEFFSKFLGYTENRTTATYATTKETTFPEYDEVTEPAPFVPHQIQIPYI